MCIQKPFSLFRLTEESTPVGAPGGHDANGPPACRIGATALPGGLRAPSTTRTHPRGMAPAWAGRTEFRPGQRMHPAVRVGAPGGHDANGPRMGAEWVLASFYAP